MQEVAHHLQIHAHGLAGPQKDAFARSAYNRYYYGCFLSLRSTFAEMNSQWEKTPHKSYPDLLNGTISKKLKSERARASRNGDGDLERLIESALRGILGVTSRKLVWPLFEQLRLQFVPVLHRLQG